VPGGRDGMGDTIMGYGKYTIGRGRKNLYERPVPQMVNSSKGVIIRHKEYLFDVPASAPLITEVFPLNPGQAKTFPWLSRVAQNFEEWVPRGIAFEYRTTSGDSFSGISPALGSIIMCTQYNALNGNFVTKAQMENYEGAVSCKPSVNMLHAVECKKSQTVMDSLFIRSGEIQAGGDLRLYDLGKTQVAVVGGQPAVAGALLGELWITYEVELRKPKIPEDPMVLSAHFTLDSQHIADMKPAQPFGDETHVDLHPKEGSTLKTVNLDGTGFAGTGGYINWTSTPPGLYLVVIGVSWTTGGTAGTWSTVSSAGGKWVKIWAGGISEWQEEWDDTTATSKTTNFMGIWQITAPGGYVEMANSSTGAGGTAYPMDVFITEMADSIK